jgi:DNA-binding MarR family transcriptional regulator
LAATDTTTRNPALEAWVGLLRSHRAALRDLGGDLQQAHGLSINDFEALVLLSRVEGGRLRRTDLAQSLQLTASGVTRLLEGLERQGLVRRAECSSDARVTYAELTEEGRSRLDEASRSHVGAIEELFGRHFQPAEVQQLAELLGRLPGVGPSCT